MRVAILHDEVPADAPPDQADTLEEARAVAAALEELGHTSVRVAVGADAGVWLEEIRAAGADGVFNLVESLGGAGRLIHVPPAWLEAAGIPFTGADALAQHVTSDKWAAKRQLRLAGLPTPPAWKPGEPPPDAATLRGRWILKPRWEHASVGLDADAVGVFPDVDALARALAERDRRGHGAYFAEAFVDGREFNVGLLAAPPGAEPEALPVAEIVFENFPDDAPRIVGYSAKWHEDSAEYRGTVRRFGTLPAGDFARIRAGDPVGPDIGKEEAFTAGALVGLARAAWTALGMAGYARVDFRVDASGRPWILEANANPCLSPDAGFAAMVAEAGLPFTDAVARILAAAQG